MLHWPVNNQPLRTNVMAATCAKMAFKSFFYTKIQHHIIRKFAFFFSVKHIKVQDKKFKKHTKVQDKKFKKHIKVEDKTF